MTIINLIPNKIEARAMAKGNKKAFSSIIFDKSKVAAFARQIIIPAALLRIIPGSLQARTLDQFLFHPRPYPEAGFTRLKRLSATEFTDLHDELMRINEDFARAHPNQTRTPKMQAVYLMEKCWIEQGLAKRNDVLGGATLAQKEPMSLFDHAYKEWKIILSLLTGQKIPDQVLGIPAVENIKALMSLRARLIIPSFKPLNSRTFLFLALFLLLHDLGKVNQGNNGHEARSEKTALLLLINPHFKLTKDEKKIMVAMIGFHSEIDEIISVNRLKAKAAKKILSDIFKQTGLPKVSAQEILQIWLLFRIAERAQSEHFGFFDESCLTDILKLSEIAFKTAFS